MGRPIRILLAGTALSAFSGTSLAQTSTDTTTRREAAAPNDADIIVTARRRTERLIDVPIAATVLTPAAIARQGITQVSEIAKQVPQLEITTAGAGSGASVSLRGVGSSSIDAGLEQPVSLVIDGVGTSRGRLIFQGLFDVQSIEALKGPQALFFGKNSPAGVLSLTTNNPGRVFEGYAKVSYNFRDHMRFVEGAISAPFSDTFAVRLAGRVYDSRGYIRNLAVSQRDPLTQPPTGSAPVFTRPSRKWLPNSSGNVFRMTARWEPTDAFDATLKVTRDEQHSGGAAALTTIVRCAPGDTRPSLQLGPLNLPDPTGTCGVDYATSIADLPFADMIPLSKSGRAFDRSTTYFNSLNMNYRTDDLTFTSVTGYINFDYLNSSNFDYGSYAVLWGALRDRLKAYTQEFRVASDFEGPFNFTAGLFYEHTDRVFEQDIKVPGFTAIGGRYDNAYSVDPTKGNTYSAFLQGSYKFTPELELAGGARFTREIKKGTLENIYVRPGANFFPVGQVIRARVASSNVSPEATLSYHPTPDSTLYAAYKTGFLSGGISNPGNIIPAATADTLTFRPVKAKGVEVGFKGSFFNRALTFSSAAYYYDYTDLQVISFEPVTFSYTTKNAASARVKGFELQANYQASPEFSLRGAMSYNHGRYREFLNGQCYAGQNAALGCVGGTQNLSGTQLGVTPDWSGNAGLTYETELSDAFGVSFSLDAFYRGSYNFTASNTFRPTAIQGEQVRMDGSIRLFQPGSTGWTLQLIGRNLTGRKTILSGSDTPAGKPGQVGGLLARPREFLLEASYRF